MYFSIKNEKRVLKYDKFTHKCKQAKGVKLFLKRTWIKIVPKTALGHGFVGEHVAYTFSLPFVILKTNVDMTFASKRLDFEFDLDGMEDKQVRTSLARPMWIQRKIRSISLTSIY